MTITTGDFQLVQVIIIVFLLLFGLVSFIIFLFRQIRRVLLRIPLPHSPFDAVLPAHFIKTINESLTMATNCEKEPVFNSDDPHYQNLPSDSTRYRVEIVAQMQDFEDRLIATAKSEPLRGALRGRPAWAAMRPHFERCLTKNSRFATVTTLNDFLSMYERARYKPEDVTQQDVQEFKRARQLLEGEIETIMGGGRGLGGSAGVDWFGSSGHGGDVGGALGDREGAQESDFINLGGDEEKVKTFGSEQSALLK